MKKPTLATLKSFIRKNEGKLFIKCESSFDGMTDCVEQLNNPQYRPATKYENRSVFKQPDEVSNQNTLGYNGVWLVGSSRDYIKQITEDGFTGFNVYNCCGSFSIAIQA